MRVEPRRQRSRAEDAFENRVDMFEVVGEIKQFIEFIDSHVRFT